MPEDTQHTFRYRVLRYTPNIIRDEWVNIGVLMEEVNGPRRAVRLIEQDAELARVRRLHPGLDEDLLRRLPGEFENRLRAPQAEAGLYLEKLYDTASLALQFSPAHAVLAEDFDMELDRLYSEHVAPPATGRHGLLENTRPWLRERLNDVFRRRGIFDKLQRNIRVEEFTQPGDPMHLDYAYHYNGTRGYIQTVALSRDPSQAKALAYTVECIRARAARTEFTAITDIEPSADNRRHQFLSRLFSEQRITLLPLNRVEQFAEELRPRLQ